MYNGEAILLISSSEHYGAVLNPDFDYKKYLETLHADGMNLARVFSGTYVEHEGSFGIRHNTLAPKGERFLCPWARSSEPGYTGGGNKFDLEDWDEVYLERLTDFLSVALDYDIMVELTLFSSIYTDESWTYCPLYGGNNINNTGPVERRKVHTPDNANLLGYQEKVVRKIVTELKDFPNLYYEIQNEPWADNTGSHYYINRNDPAGGEQSWRYHVEVPSDTANEWQAMVAGWISDTEKDYTCRHLIAQNFTNFYYPVAQVDSVVSVMNFHYVWPQAVSLNYGYDRVISFDEDGFMGNQPAPYRKGAWNFILAGGGIYNNLDYSFFPGAEDGIGVNDAPGHGSKTYRQQLAFLKQFMEGFDFIHLTPDPSVIKLAPDTFPQVLANPGKEYAIYLDGGSQSDLQLNLPEGTYLASWINPVTFMVEKAEEIKSSDGPVSLKSPEYNGEIALKVVRVK
jgi:hypothetical protein